MFLNPEIRNRLLQKKQYMNEMNNNPFIMKTFIDDRVYLQEESNSEPKEFKKIVFKEKGKKDSSKISLPPDIEMLIPKKNLVHDDEVPENTDVPENTEDTITEVVEDKQDNESNGELSEDLFGGDALSSDEKNNTKTIIVNHSFF